MKSIMKLVGKVSGENRIKLREVKRDNIKDTIVNRILAEWHAVPVGGIVIIEGIYSFRKELANNYHLKIWMRLSTRNKTFKRY